MDQMLGGELREGTYKGAYRGNTGGAGTTNAGAKKYDLGLAQVGITERERERETCATRRKRSQHLHIPVSSCVLDQVGTEGGELFFKGVR